MPWKIPPHRAQPTITSISLAYPGNTHAQDLSWAKKESKLKTVATRFDPRRCSVESLAPREAIDCGPVDPRHQATSRSGTRTQLNRSKDDTRRVVRVRKIAQSSGMVPITITSTVATRLSTSTTAVNQDRTDIAEAEIMTTAAPAHRIVRQVSVVGSYSYSASRYSYSYSGYSKRRRSVARERGSCKNLRTFAGASSNGRIARTQLQNYRFVLVFRRETGGRVTSKGAKLFRGVFQSDAALRERSPSINAAAILVAGARD